MVDHTSHGIQTHEKSQGNKIETKQSKIWKFKGQGFIIKY